MMRGGVSVALDSFRGFKSSYLLQYAYCRKAAPSLVVLLQFDSTWSSSQKSTLTSSIDSRLHSLTDIGDVSAPVLLFRVIRKYQPQTN